MRGSAFSFWRRRCSAEAAADGARIFILPWLAASVINMVIGVYWASVPLSTEIPVLAVVFGVPAAIAWYLARWLRARSEV